MPFNSRAYRVLIASPSDVDEEREIAVRVIQEWNDLYAYTRGVVLLPLRWETHAAPEYGTRPQEVINRVIVDQCDLLLGIFWTRIGTPTGVAESGTLEEIVRVAQLGKPVMLYFSKVGTDPDQIDLDQLHRLKKFKADTCMNALTESYRSHIEFRDKLARQLELKIRDLQKADTSGGPPPLELSFAAPDLKSLEGQRASRVAERINVVDMDVDIPSDEKVAERRNKAIRAEISRAATVPIVLALRNTGTSGVRNLYVDVEVTASTGLTVTDSPPERPGVILSSDLVVWTTNFGRVSEYQWKGPNVARVDNRDLEEGFKETDSGWRLTFEWSALQPNRRRWVAPALYVKATQDGTARFVAKVYADSLPEPVTLDAELVIHVREQNVRIADLLGVTKEVTDH
jgi:hypothetical protein